MKTIIEAGTARAIPLASGDQVTIVNTHGSQVVDTWALSAGDRSEYLSVEHTRAENLHVSLRVGDRLYSNRRKKLMTLVEDTSPGHHDMLMPACDVDRYRVLGHRGYHRNCRDNFEAALRDLGPSSVPMPNPLNLFQNMSWTATGELSFAPPSSSPGDAVCLCAEVDLLLVMSACPQDMLPVNGAAMTPRDVQFEVERTSSPA